MSLFLQSRKVPSIPPKKTLLTNTDLSTINEGLSYVTILDYKKAFEYVIKPIHENLNFVLSCDGLQRMKLELFGNTQDIHIDMFDSILVKLQKIAQIGSIHAGTNAILSGEEQAAKIYAAIKVRAGL